MQKIKKIKSKEFEFPKSLTGIMGLDDITVGGLPKNRATLIAGNAGSGKTLLAMQFLINGINLCNESGVFMSFEEKTKELVLNFRSLGYDLDDLQAKKDLYLEYVKVGKDEALRTGDYTIEGLFVRLETAIKKVKAKRVILDSISSLFDGLDDRILRTELHRLFDWLKKMKVTAIVTSEAGDNFITKMGLEEYIADCVIVLDNRIKDQISTRRLRIVKYRGSSHGNNEYPFTIDENGLNVFPIISIKEPQKVSSQRISSGIKSLDDMMGGNGFYLGSSILVSGSAGTGKTSIAASFAYSACENKCRSLYCAFEESPNQIKRNMASIGVNLDKFVKSKQLYFYYSRPTLQNLELHFIAIKKIIADIKPSVIIMDPITNLMTEGPTSDIRSMLTRFVDYLKGEQITVFFTAAITAGSIVRNPSDEGISSMVDTWMMVDDENINNLRKRSLSIIKSRGMPHSNEVKTFDITSKGITLGKRISTIDTADSKIKKNEKEL